MFRAVAHGAGDSTYANRIPRCGWGQEVRFGHMKAQWARTFAEYLTWRVATQKSDSFYQATLDAGLQLFQYAKEEDIHRMVQELPEDLREGFVKAWNGSVAVAASHSEMVL